MGRRSNTEARRRQIVEGMLQAMSQVGYDGATIPLIAKSANLTPGLVHYHFKSKQEILIELISYLMSLLEERYQDFSRSAVTAEDKLACFIDAHVGLGKKANQNAVACWIAIGAEAVRTVEVQEAYQTATSKQLKILDALCSESLLNQNRSRRKSREIALAIVACIEGFYRLLISAPASIPKGFAASTIKQMVFHLIASQPSA